MCRAGATCRCGLQLRILELLLGHLQHLPTGSCTLLPLDFHLAYQGDSTIHSGPGQAEMKPLCQPSTVPLPPSPPVRGAEPHRDNAAPIDYTSGVQSAQKEAGKLEELGTAVGWSPHWQLSCAALSSLDQLVSGPLVPI